MLMPASLNVLPVLFLNFLERVKNKEAKVQSKVRDIYCWPQVRNVHIYFFHCGAFKSLNKGYIEPYMKDKSVKGSCWQQSSNKHCHQLISKQVATIYVLIVQ